jgi:hypothetical protein
MYRRLSLTDRRWWLCRLVLYLWLVCGAPGVTVLCLQFEIHPKECECKRVKFGLAELTKIMKNSTFSETPFYFSVTVQDSVYMLASATERDRSRWIIFIKNLAVSVTPVPDGKTRLFLNGLLIYRDLKSESPTLGLPQAFW